VKNCGGISNVPANADKELSTAWANCIIAGAQLGDSPESGNDIVVPWIVIDGMVYLQEHQSLRIVVKDLN